MKSLFESNRDIKATYKGLVEELCIKLPLLLEDNQ